MTDEIFIKAQEIKAEISDIETLRYFLNNYVFHLNIQNKKKCKILAKRFPSEYEIKFPIKLQEKILNVVTEYWCDKKLEYKLLGCEIKE